MQFWKLYLSRLQSLSTTQILVGNTLVETLKNAVRELFFTNFTLGGFGWAVYNIGCDICDSKAR